MFDKKKPNKNDPNMVYSVMPRSNDSFSNSALTSSAPAQPQPQTQAPQAQMAEASLPEEKTSIWHSKTTYIVMGIILLLILGGLAYFLLGSGGLGGGQQQITADNSRLPTVFLKRYFSVDICLNQEECGDAGDPDLDGLQNYDEFREQTDPTMNDSDADGLADGDEVNIYQTDPRNKYTDSRPAAEQNDYNDGSQIKNEYDPLTPGLKMTEIRKQQIQKNADTFKLHSPTVETLKSVPPKTVTVTIANNKFSEGVVHVNLNDTVTWTNNDIAAHQIASEPHPAHTLLPELESGTLATNQSFSFKFTKTGSFPYHDHLNPIIKGIVEVK
jgi:plastocyanin